MAVSTCSITWAPALPSNKLNVMAQQHSRSIELSATWKSSAVAASKETTMITPSSEADCCPRRSILAGVATIAVGLLRPNTVIAEVSQKVPANYRVFVDEADGYSYYYPSDWREFDFRAHDSAFKDRYLQLQNVRLSFIPTDKKDVHDLGPMEQVIPDLVKDVYSAPNQAITINGMEERTAEGKNYYTVEYVLKSPNFARTAFTTIAIANGRHYTLIVGANDRRWKRVRNQLKVVADSFKVFDI